MRTASSNRPDRPGGAAGLLWLVALALAAVAFPAASGLAAQPPAPDLPPFVRAQEESGGEVMARYAAAVRYFNRRLAGPQARQLAKAIINSSLDHGLDARMLVAILVVDDSLPRARAGRKSLLIGGRPAAQVVEAAAEDLSRRLERLSAGRPVDRGVVREALAERGAQQVRRTHRSAKESAAYAKRVLVLYQKMCGESPPPAP